MHKIYWLEYVNANDNHSHDGIMTETFWYKSDMIDAINGLDPDNAVVDYGSDVVDLD